MDKISKQEYIRFYKGLLSPLGYLESDKTEYDKGVWLGDKLNTYLRWINDNDHEQFCKEVGWKFNRIENIKKEYQAIIEQFLI
jgi:hypothetical protein